jgi:hypothetical protein
VSADHVEGSVDGRYGDVVERLGKGWTRRPPFGHGVEDFDEIRGAAVG